MFTVNIPFGPYDTGDKITAETIRQTVPGCDLARLVRLGSLVPEDGFDVGTLADPTASQEQAEEVIADLHENLMAADTEIRRLREKVSEAESRALTATADTHAAVASHDATAVKLAEAMAEVADLKAKLAGVVPAAPKDDDTAEIVTKEVPPAEPPAKKKK